jgi:hypothetical protein
MVSITVAHKKKMVEINMEELPCGCGGVGASEGDGERTALWMDGG